MLVEPWQETSRTLRRHALSDALYDLMVRKGEREAQARRKGETGETEETSGEGEGGGGGARRKGLISDGIGDGSRRTSHSDT